MANFFRLYNARDNRQKSLIDNCAFLPLVGWQSVQLNIGNVFDFVDDDEDVVNVDLFENVNC